MVSTLFVLMLCVLIRDLDSNLTAASVWFCCCSETDIDECASNPCQLGGTCTDLEDGFHCECFPGYSGFKCETNIDECASAPCMQPGSNSCVDGINSFSCLCSAGYSGSICQTNINECSSIPCQNGGTCTDLVVSGVGMRMTGCSRVTV